jgi:hypothetical protein
MTSVLEKLGCIVITNEDMDISNIDVTEEILMLEEIAEPIKLRI